MMNRPSAGRAPVGRDPVEATRRPRPARRRRRAGLTLIEVMIAMAILGIGIFVLLESAAKCLAIIRLTKNYHTARTVLDQGELEHPIIEKEDEVYNLDVSPVSYENGFTFSRTAEASDQEGLMVVRTRVSWADKGSNRMEEVVSYLYNTNAAPSP
jgi:prepilin-type N-terminal cleavage/methylation domain-containing protein